MKTANEWVFESSRQSTIVPGFNVFGHEDAVAITRAAERADSPVMLMVNRDAKGTMDIAHWGALLGSIAKRAVVPVGVHLDHCSDLNLILQAMDSGFTSVMFDGSKMPLEQNVEETRKVVSIARERGICVEGEVGVVPYNDLGDKLGDFTAPEEARALSEAGGADWVAVSVGNVHRLIHRKVPIDFKVLNNISCYCKAPLVIHGASGIAEQDIHKLKASSVGKINIGTAIRYAFGTALRKVVTENPDMFDRLALFDDPIRSVEDTAYNLIRMLRSSG